MNRGRGEREGRNYNIIVLVKLGSWSRVTDPVKSLLFHSGDLKLSRLSFRILTSVFCSLSKALSSYFTEGWGLKIIKQECPQLLVCYLQTTIYSYPPSLFSQRIRYLLSQPRPVHLTLLWTLYSPGPSGTFVLTHVTLATGSFSWSTTSWFFPL